ncbi:phosphatase PAP2 family protein [Marixanthomonas ophiurae]|uniref:Phosphatase PAP2 family protein n=2 Tax=Marixanthomonas ophiurae TaxID=387659 RepID=A0A3E1Q877_9FLAO|nr:phosphatase PAP2 family protein [Marixanthomonas ophiurae]
MIYLMIMKKTTTTLLLLLISFTTFSQTKDSPYEWDWVRDGIWTGAALGTTVTGYSLIIGKDDITEAKLQQEVANQDNINFIDKWAVGYESEAAIGQSNIPFAMSFASPFVLLFDDEVNEHTAQILGLYLESLSTTAGLYTVTAGLVNRSRPYVYNEDVSLERRLINNGQRSFYSGHVAAAATATFFAAKVYSDFNPDSPAKVWVWAGAATIPAAVGYFRIKAGQHFLTDVLLGYGLGAVTGYFVPELHKTDDSVIEVVPSAGMSATGDIYRGIGLQMTF